MALTETQKWVLDTIFDKAAYDIRKSTNPDVNRLDDYIAANAFIATVQLRSYGATCHIRDAQRRLEKAFGKYHASELRKQCFANGKVTRRNKKFQPLAFIAFDIEGSRQNGFSTTTLYPHGHGIVLFHERTLDNFKEANARFLTLDDGYIISNPTPAISLIDLKPVGGFDDLSRHLGYSLKLESKLQNGDTNYAPHNFYPASSVDFPFSRSPAPATALSSHRSVTAQGSNH